MKLLYTAAWIVIIGFLVWSGNLLLEIQAIGSETAHLHRMNLSFDKLAEAWRDLNRPGNDVLENYEVQRHNEALASYKRRYNEAWQDVGALAGVDAALAPLMDEISAAHDTVVALAEQILELAKQREILRQAQAPPERISEKETKAATAMAHMDQTFQDGMDLILLASSSATSREGQLEERQTDNFRRLFIMLLVMLLMSAMSLELTRRILRQRAALRESAARIRTIVDNVVDGIVTVDNQGYIESINLSAQRMFGYTPPEVKGCRFTTLLHDSCREAYLDQIGHEGSQTATHVLLTGACEGLGLRRDATTFPLELAISRVAVRGRKLLIHIVRDITERRQADQKQRLAASVFETATEGIMITDVDGIIQSVNPAYIEMTQYRADELVGKNPRILQSGKQDPEFYRDVWTSIRESGHWQGELWDRRKDGESFPIWLTVNAIKNSQGRITNYVGVAWDISELKASQHMKEEFITTISHELRTPLTSVLGSLGMLMGTLNDHLPEQARRLVNMAHSNSMRLVRLISDILDIEKIEAGKMTFVLEPLNLVDLVLHVIEDSKALAEQAQVTVSCEVHAHEVCVSGDSDRLMQALANLLSNAIKFSGAGQTVQVVVEHRKTMLRVAVRDQGPGIPEEYYDQIFKKFVQAGPPESRGRDSTGLGLNIAKLIVQKHAGRIGFHSTRGQGTTFYIDLPRVDCAPAVAPALDD
ncbi:MAG: PAS domain-containing sensor histidine kinase [Thiogranum sp.]